MAQAEANNLTYLLNLALGAVKDRAFQEALQSVQTAQREYLIADAEARRGKSNAIIQQMAKLDAAVLRLRREYSRVGPMLTPDAQARFEELFDSLSRQRTLLVQKKKSLSSGAGALSAGPEQINGVLS